MIISMTGFGKSEGSYGKTKYRVEITSVNNRFFETYIRLPRKFAPKEHEIRELLRSRVSRGKLSVFVTAEGETNGTGSDIHSDKSVKEFLALAKKINRIIGSESQVTLRDILELGEYVTLTDVATVDEKEYEFVSELIGKAADDLLKMKSREGKHLEKDMLLRIKLIEKETSSIALLSKKRVKDESERLKKRLSALLDSKSEIDERRLELEVALLADKSDITEELIRLKSHINVFSEYVRAKELAGRRLNFLLQEINREINTIASKASDAVISQKSAILKEELEKIREQVQNIE